MEACPLALHPLGEGGGVVDVVEPVAQVLRLNCRFVEGVVLVERPASNCTLWSREGTLIVVFRCTPRHDGGRDSEEGGMGGRDDEPPCIAEDRSVRFCDSCTRCRGVDWCAVGVDDAVTGGQQSLSAVDN